MRQTRLSLHLPVLIFLCLFLAFRSVVCAQTLPAPWATANLGTVGLSGSATVTNGTFYVSGGGADIWDAADAFRFVYVPLTGNCSVVARVIAVGNSDGWAKAGVMIREYLTASSRNAMMLLSCSNGTAFTRRTSTGSSSIAVNPWNDVQAPYWIRLERVGNVFTGYKSPDGRDWVAIGSDSVTMNSKVYVGLAVTAHNNALLCQATFDSVEAAAAPALSNPGLRAEFYGTTNLTSLLLTQTNMGVNFDWICESPINGGPRDNFSIRWSGWVKPAYSETYTFTTRTCDGVRLRVADRLLVSSWPYSGWINCTGSVSLQADRWYPIEFDYYNINCAAAARLWWSSPSQPQEIVPKERLCSLALTTFPVNPTNVAVAPGATAAFTGLATGSGPFTYQWQYNGSNIAGATATALVLTNVLPAAAGTYQLQASNALGIKASSAATLSVLSPPWLTANAGVVGVAGFAAASNGTCLVAGSGADIWGTADGCQFLYMPITGSCSVVARVLSLEPTDSWAKAGVMIRESLDAGSRQAAMLLSPTNGSMFHWRLAAGGDIASIGIYHDVLPPWWLKLERVGDVFTAYKSPDGLDWVAIGSDAVPMNAVVYAGLAVTAHNNTVLCRALFDNVRVESLAAPASPGLRAEFFGTTNLTGLLLTRTNMGVNFDWTCAAPFHGGPGENFSIRWSGWVRPRYSGTYTFETVTDDGVRLCVNDQWIISRWSDSGPVNATGLISLQAGQWYPLLLEYFNLTCAARARLYWSSASQAREIVPLTCLDSTQPTTFGLQPSGIAAQAGQTVAFYSSASGAAPLYYQWRFNGSDLAGATTTALVLTNVQTSQAGVYQLLASNAMGTVSSRQATLRMFPVFPTNLDIGSVGRAGSAVQTNGIYYVSGGGTDIWDVADAFRFVSMPLTGNCSIAARVISLGNADGWAKAGLMVREDLSASSRNAMMLLSCSNGTAFQRRLTSGGGSIALNPWNDVRAPYWIKLERVGNVFTGYKSPDGRDWVAIGSDAVPMSDVVYVGLAVTAHDNAQLCLATFDNVEVQSLPLLVDAGLRAEFFGTTNLTGLLVTQTNMGVNFDWICASPIAGGPPDNFSVRWSGWVKPAFSERFTFTTRTCDGVRLRVGDNLLIMQWPYAGWITATGSVSLQAECWYPIEVDYYNVNCAAGARLWWSSPSQAREIVPVDRLRLAPPLDFLQQPQSLTTISGADAGFTARLTVATPSSYQWYKDGTPLSDGLLTTGTAAASLNLSRVQPASAGTYWVVASNSLGCLTSAVAVLTIDTSSLPAGREQCFTYDAWTRIHSLTGGATALASSPAADGIPNSLKFAMGLDPKVPLAAPLFAPFIAEQAGQRFFALRVQRSRLALSARLSLLASEDLVTWVPCDTVMESLSVLSQEAELVQLRCEDPLSTRDRRFFRLQGEVDPSAGQLITGPEVEVLQESVGPQGGTLTVRTPGPLCGLSLLVPENAFSTTQVFTISYRPIVSDNYAVPCSAITPLIHVDNKGGLAAEPMLLTIPIQRQPDSFAMGFFYDAATGQAEGIPSVAQSTNSITLATRHFCFFTVEQAKRADLANLIATMSRFQLGVDHWEFGNFSSYVAPDNSIGMSESSMWYFLSKRLRGGKPLYNLLDNSALYGFNGCSGSCFSPESPVDEDNLLGRRLCSVLSHDSGASGGFSGHVLCPSDDQDTLRAFKFSIFKTGLPQFLGAMNNSESLCGVAYGVQGDRILVYDPNATSVWRGFNPQADPPCVVYDASLRRFRAFTTHKPPDDRDVTYTCIQYQGLTAFTDWAGFGRRWKECEDMSIGQSLFPVFQIGRLATGESAPGIACDILSVVTTDLPIDIISRPLFSPDSFPYLLVQPLDRAAVSSWQYCLVWPTGDRVGCWPPDSLSFSVGEYKGVSVSAVSPQAPNLGPVWAGFWWLDTRLLRAPEITRFEQIAATNCGYPLKTHSAVLEFEPVEGATEYRILLSSDPTFPSGTTKTITASGSPAYISDLAWGGFRLETNGFYSQYNMPNYVAVQARAGEQGSGYSEVAAISLGPKTYPAPCDISGINFVFPDPYQIHSVQYVSPNLLFTLGHGVEVTKWVNGTDANWGIQYSGDRVWISGRFQAASAYWGIIFTGPSSGFILHEHSGWSAIGWAPFSL